MTTMYDRIKEKRIELKMSQDELAKRMGYTSRSTISRIEGNEFDIANSKIVEFAKVLDTTTDYLMGNTEKSDSSIRIPVLGRIIAGNPVEMVEDALGYEYISPILARSGNYFALKINGHSMEPNIMENDIVIVRQQNEIESDQIAIVEVNGNEATCKKVVKDENGLTLVGYNVSVFPPKHFTGVEVEKLPISILGKVVEIRRKV